MRTVTKLPAKPVKTVSTCAVSFAEFTRNSDNAPAISIAGQSVPMEAREYSTGSFGWMIDGRPTFTVKLDNGTEVEVTADVKLYVKNSKTAIRGGDDNSVLNPTYLAKLEASSDDVE